MAPLIGRILGERSSARTVLGLRRTAIIEVVLFLAVALAIDAIAFSGHRFLKVEPHPFWIIVLLAAAQYGTAEGLLAAALSTLALLVGNIPEQPIDQDVYEHLFAIVKNPIMWFVAAVSLGELRSRQLRERGQLRTDLHEATSRMETLAEAYRRLTRIKENLEVRVVGQLRTFLTTYETARMIERSDPGEVLLAIVDVIRTIITPEKFSLYLLNNTVLEAAIQDGWQQSDRFARVFDAQSKIFQKIIGDRRVLCVTNESDEPILGREGVLAGPLISSDTDTVIGMLKVEKLELLDLNVSTVENFRALSSWIGTAYAKAVGLAAHAVEREYTAGRDVMPQRYLVPEQYFLISLARRQGFDISAASIQLTNPEQVPADRRALLPAAISSAVRLALGSSSLPFESQASGHGFMVLMPGMGYRGAQAAAERLEASLTTQLKEYAPEARFDIGVQSIYQHDRRGADDEPTDA
ncbi:MAG: GAF domain-containing protein [Alphaproteobacteria bacterium]